MKNVIITPNVINNNLSVAVTCDNDVEIKQYNLLRYGSKINIVQSSEKYMAFNLAKEGVYVVSVNIINNGSPEVRYTFPVSYFKEQTRKEISDILNQENDNLSFEVDLCELKYPYQYVAMVYNKNNSTIDLTNIDSKIILTKFSHKKHEHYLLSSMPIEEKKQKCCFSGMANVNGQFIYGANDIDENIHKKLFEKIGGFSYILADEKKVLVANDFFGINKTYYFENNDFLITSNQYHLLLLIMKKLNIKPTLNMDIIKGQMGCNHYMFAQQIYSRESIFNGIKMLAPDEYIEIENIIKIKQTTFAELQKTEPKEIDRKEYFETIKKAQEEILSNLNCIFQNKSINKVTVDVTGGLDSRMVLAAISNIEDFDKKVKAHTLDISNDLPIACSLINAIGMEFDDSPAFTQPFMKTIDYKTSLFMGGTFKRFPIRNEKKYTAQNVQKISISGGFGEQVTRYYLIKDFYKTYLSQILDIDLFTSEFMKQISKESISYICDYDSSVQFAEKELQKEIKLLKGYDNLEKLESHFLVYRGPLHFKQYMYVGNIWLPLQSKNMFKLFKQTARKNNMFKLGFETVCNFNDVLGNLPYADDSYNSSFNLVHDELNLINTKYKNLKITPDYGVEKKQKADEKARELARDIPKSLLLDEENRKMYENQLINIYDDLLKKLPAFSKILPEIALQLYYYCKEMGPNNRMNQWVWARVSTILEQLEIFK